MSKVLIVSHAQDSHTAVMAATLSELGTDPFVLDLSSFPASSTLTYDYQGSDVAIQVGERGSLQALGEFGAAWWRRPQHVDTSLIADHAENLFAQGEWDEALSALWPMLDVFWVNEPHIDRLASRKGWQLKVAKSMGMSIPRTLITTDPDRANDFVQACGGPDRTVYKSFSATHAAWRETRRLRPDELQKLDMVRVAPVIFQEYVPAGVDLRVTVIGENIFPAAIHSADTDYPTDFRMSLGRGVRIEPATLPQDIQSALLALMRRLGLVYGAIDLRRTPEDEHVFLEVNTAGQWLFVEEATDQPIAHTFATLLAKEAATRG